MRRRKCRACKHESKEKYFHHNPGGEEQEWQCPNCGSFDNEPIVPKSSKERVS